MIVFAIHSPLSAREPQKSSHLREYLSSFLCWMKSSIKQILETTFNVNSFHMKKYFSLLFFSFILASETDGCYVTCQHKTYGTEPMNTGRCHPSRWILTDADGSPINCIVASLPIMSNDDGHFPLSADVYRSDDDQLIEKLLTWACTTSRSWRNRAAGFRSLVFTTSAPFYSDKDDQHSEKLPLYLTPDKHNQ